MIANKVVTLSNERSMHDSESSAKITYFIKMLNNNPIRYDVHNATTAMINIVIAIAIVASSTFSPEPANIIDVASTTIVEK